jgi:hypothetical protein
VIPVCFAHEGALSKVVMSLGPVNISGMSLQTTCDKSLTEMQAHPGRIKQGGCQSPRRARSGLQAVQFRRRPGPVVNWSRSTSPRHPVTQLNKAIMIDSSTRTHLPALPGVIISISISSCKGPRKHHQSRPVRTRTRPVIASPV